MRRRVSMRTAAAALVALVVLAACDRGGGKVTEASAESANQADSSSSNAGAAEATGDERYETVVRPETVATASKQTVELVVVPASGLKVNREYPNWTLTLTPPEGVDLNKTSFSADDFTLDDTGAHISTTLTANSPGDHRISGTAGFSVCNDETCHIMRDEKVSFRLHAKDDTDHGHGR